MPTPDQLMDELISRAAINDLIVEYALARDTTDPDRYRRIFSADAQIKTGTGHVLSDGIDQILAKVHDDQERFNPASRSGERSWGSMRHEPSNVLMHIRGDSARSEYYMKTLAFNEDRRRPEVIAAGRIEDEYERRNGHWWIVSSTMFFQWEHEEMGRALQVGPYTPARYKR